MKIIVNRCYGGFSISDEACKILGIKSPYYFDREVRQNAKLIALIEEKGCDFVSGDFANLKVVEIPEDATDFYINEYDGLESLIYVLNGKLHFKK